MNDEKKRNGPAHRPEGSLCEEARPEPDELARTLQIGDPAAGAPQLDAAELTEMRRAIVKAAYEAQDTSTGSWAWLNISRPLAVSFATIVIALFAVWMFTATPGTEPGDPGTGGEQESGVVADASPPPATPTEPGDAAAATTQAQTTPSETTTLPNPPIEAPVPAEQIASSEQVTPPPTLEAEIAQPEPATATTVADTSPPAKEARTVQFTAPRGTRIIWTLDPNFVSPLSEQTARQEQEQ